MTRIFVLIFAGKDLSKLRQVLLHPHGCFASAARSSLEIVCLRGVQSIGLVAI